MEKITIDNKSCLFLSHQKLIDNLYKQYDANFVSYSLKQEIFNFKPKIPNPSSKKAFKRLENFDRKRKAESPNGEVNEESLNLHPFIKEIQKKIINLPEIYEEFPRFWEESQKFPQFHGANYSNEYQITTFSQKDFIVPPKTKFYNYDIENLPRILPELEIYDLLVMDMPWQNKYIKRLKRVKTSLAYDMLSNEALNNIPVSQLIHKNSLVALWCTNALQHRKAIELEFLPNWNLQLVHKLKWFKINTLGELVCPPKPEGYKQPYELLYIACHKQRNILDLIELTKVDFLISIPSIIHSHKPPLVEWLRKFLSNGDNFKGLEIFARYLQPQFTSIGLEVLKLMDKRLYHVAQNTKVGV